MTSRLRFAPSPTGALHLGGARTAVINWLMARSVGGELCLRIEDTDRERSQPELVEAILSDLDWLGVDFDRGPLFQSERRATYERAIDRLGASGAIYERDGATYLSVPDDRPLRFDDGLRGEVTFPPGSFSDFVVRRSDGSFVFNLAAAVDDLEMGITDVVRGEDHIPNTPLQRLVIEALGGEPPRYIHLPLLLGREGGKLSKRHGALPIAEFRAQGYLPEALVNYFALVSFHLPDGEVQPVRELVQAFAVERLHRTAARFDPDKLRWLTGQHMRRLDHDDLRSRMGPPLELGPSPAGIESEAMLEAIRTAGPTLADAARAARLFEAEPEPDAAALEVLGQPGARDALRALMEALEGSAAGGPAGELGGRDIASARRMLASVRDSLREQGTPARVTMHTIRAALTGRASGPELPYFVAALPRDELIRRLRGALERTKEGPGEKDK